MKTSCLFFAAFVFVSAVSGAGLTPSSEVDLARFAQRKKEIVPGLLFYGVKWYSHSADVINELGPPTGRIDITDDSFVFLYGKQHTLIFEKDELREVTLSQVGAIQFLGIGERMLNHPFFDSADVVIQPGLKLGMNLEAAKALLPGKLDQFNPQPPRDMKVSYISDYAVVTLHFGTSFRPEGKFYEISSITIRGN